MIYKKSCIITTNYNIMSETNDSQQSTGKCTICLQSQVNASIDGCQHAFCLKCIRKWSKNNNTCPLCRKPFLSIKQRHRTYKVNQPKKNVSQRRAASRLIAPYYPLVLNPIPLYWVYFPSNQNNMPNLIFPLQHQINYYQNVPLYP